MKKRTVLLTAIVLIFTSIQANAQVTFGIKGGLNGTKFILKDGNTTDKAYGLMSLHLGVTAELPLSEQIFVEPALLFSGKGGKITESNGIFSDERFNLTYAELPVNFLYKYPLNEDKLKVVAFGGPYLGILLSAKDKQGNQSEDFKDELKSLDAGLNIGAGVELDKLTFGIQYGIGLANIAKASSTTMHNRVFGISIGYKFRKD